MRTAIAMLVLLALQTPARPQASRPSQYDVQAVYLYDFAKFVRWPTTDGPLRICIAGPTAFADALTKIVAGEHIDTRPITVRRVDHPEDTAACSILFISASAHDRADAILAAVVAKPILTVSDAPGFLDRGGMIQFLLIANRVRFAVSLPPATRSGLSLSSELLKVAVTVNGATTGEGPQ